ncbi:hypothetical protein DFH29DRAFT_1000095 [Suillus ampliporus]|nr:hypothetical protein DFH29DRAFT_1000095 [Suillus ampliporus]
MTTHAPTTSCIDFQYRKRIFAAAAVIILCTQFQIMQMTQQDSAKAEKANWNDAETDALLEYLISCRSKLAGTTFKTDRFNEAAAHLHTKKLKTHGPMKTGAHCKNKWNLVFEIRVQSNQQIPSEIGRSLGPQWLGPIFRGLPPKRHGQIMLAGCSTPGMKQFKNGWKYYTKMQQILTHVSAAHGVAAYNPAVLATAGPAAESESVPGSSTGGVGSSTSGAGASTSGDPGDDGVSMADGMVMATAEDFSWDIPPLRIPAPVASTSLAAAPPVSSSGKCSHTDMIFNTTPPSLTSSTLMSEVPRAYSDTKKAKLLVQGGSNGGGGSNKTRATSSKKAIKEAASTAALMNLQGTINHLSDSITTSFTVTDESRISDERSRALQNMQQKEGLSTEDKLSLMHAFMRSPISVIMEAKQSITL